MPHVFAGVATGKQPKPARLPVRFLRWLKGTPWRCQAKMYPLDGKPLPFSHAYLRWHDIGRSGAVYNLVVHSTMKHGVDVESIEDAFAERVPYAEFQIEVSDDQFRRFVAWAYRENGKAYSRWQLIGIGFVRIAEWLARKVLGWEVTFQRNPLGNGASEHVCSETGVEGLRTNVRDLFGPTSFQRKDADLIAPAEFYADLCWCEQQYPDRITRSTRKT